MKIIPIIFKILNCSDYNTYRKHYDLTDLNQVGISHCMEECCGNKRSEDDLYYCEETGWDEEKKEPTKVQACIDCVADRESQIDSSKRCRNRYILSLTV